MAGDVGVQYSFYVRFQVLGVYWTVHARASNLGLPGQEYMEILDSFSDEGQVRTGPEWETWIASLKQSGDFWLAVVSQLRTQALGVLASPMAEA